MNHFSTKAVKTALTVLASLLMVATAATPAQAAFGVAPGSFQTNVLGTAGEVLPLPQAGSHPFIYQLAFAMNTRPNPIEGGYLPPGPEPNPDGSIKDARVELPPGIAGRPQSVPRCTTIDFTPAGFAGNADCPTGSQIGIARIDVGFEDGFHHVISPPIFNLVPPEGVVARIGFVADQPFVTDFTVRTGSDYGVTATLRNATQAANFYGISMELWGVPADPRHDAQRYLPGAFSPGDGHGNSLSSGLTPAPFIDLPARCNIGLATHIGVDSWEEPGSYQSSETPPGEFGGCDSLGFSPSLQVASDTSTAGAPMGLAVQVKVPQSTVPQGVVSSPLKDAVVTLPQGVSVNPSAAAGMTGCSPDQVNLGSDAAPSCPSSSKLGTARIVTPLLDHTLEGSVYLATQGSNPFNSLLAMYLVVVDPDTGVVLKLPGKISTDPLTGRITTSFDDNPQLPFEYLNLQLKGGSGAALIAPTSCGIYTAHAEFTGWAQPERSVSSDSSFRIDEGCGAASQFKPGLSAGSSNPTAGAFSPFVLRVTRQDGEQNLSRIEATLPPGVLAKLAGVPLCGDAQAATGDCPAASQVGTTTVAAGAGPDPIYVPQPGKAPTAVYLAGPYNGAPYSLVVKVPAQAGPFDLGVVTVRNALYVDPTTTQVTAKSDPLPQILQGIPLAYRDVRVEINRNDFTLNPTSCEPMQVTSLLTSSVGMRATPSARFQVANCEGLAFKPSLALSFKGQTKRTGDPALAAVLKAPAGQANIAKTAVILPSSVFIDNRHINNPCTRVQFAANACPAKSILGTATAYTPLLDKPLTGPVYFRSNGGERKLPDLVADLNGQIHVVLVGFIDSVKSGKESSRVRTRFQSVPDAPVSKFELKLYGGKRGLIQSSTNICKELGKATVQMTGQNGKPNDFETAIGTSCGGKKGKKAKPRGGH